MNLKSKLKSKQIIHQSPRVHQEIVCLPGRDRFVMGPVLCMSIAVNHCACSVMTAWVVPAKKTAFHSPSTCLPAHSSYFCLLLPCSLNLRSNTTNAPCRVEQSPILTTLVRQILLCSLLFIQKKELYMERLRVNSLE